MKKWSSAWAGLAISYGSIVVVIVLLICSFFYIYFSRSYNEELQNKNQLILENTTRTIEGTILQRVQQIYLDLSLDKSADIRLFAEPSTRSGLDSVIDLQELLKSKVAGNADMIQAIHLYYPGQNIMLSSLYGLRYNADQGEGSAYYSDWLQDMRASKQNSLWTASRQVPQDIFSSVPGGTADSSNALFTYTHSYPFQSTGETGDVYIAIDVKESAVSSIIENMMPSQYKSTFIVNHMGNTISNANTDTLGQPGEYGASIKKALQSGNAKGSFDDKIDNTSVVVSYQTLPSTGWTIYSAMPASFYYEQSIMVQKLILGICMIAIVIGLALSAVLLRANYSPIKRLVSRIKDLSGPATTHITNEYRLIDSAFMQLNDKVSSLEETLLANSPAIKHNAVLNLLHGGYSREQWAEERTALGISYPYHAYSCLLLNTGVAHMGLSSENLPSVISRFIHGLESLSLPDSRLIAEELPDKKLAVILCTDIASEPLLDKLSQLLLSEAQQQFQLDIQLSLGSWVQELADVHRSFSEAQALMKYAYFLPELYILKDRSILQREHNMDEIPQTILAKFRDKLHARQPDEAVAAVDQFIATMREGLYPADYCHFMLVNAVFVYSDVVKNVRYKHPLQLGHPDLYHEYISIANIVAYRDWLVESITVFISETEKRNSERAVSTIGLAKQYIEEHLSEDLSLEAVGAQVFISSKYLSKLFKEELGVTYTDYVTSRRMERAKVLIENNNMTIERIASSVGYGTTAYFIKRFKEMYGCTPGHYLRKIASAGIAEAGS
ncbi:MULTISPECIES: AraC family transcriptional regulator [unclassified Paenibacillus]|uniref:AraC family transcriptional regulator n=1 Tax=unclassified Paenibacillus TaxID=185978 RepID=UPI0009A812DD|nr:MULTISPECIES: AraC family transcriptional regulator [unclassified Paenibacillus]SLK17526.1 AraC-type DNA-binding protein [Paenibacillus sp. RU5A]SOC74825.1 AraC-type DNA-binding protein [Paenibacillus sp. RU26A]SOC76943.1 AraC-type DNA-binding protein [Paenibacillus sp. RU5M]